MMLDIDITRRHVFSTECVDARVQDFSFLDVCYLEAEFGEVWPIEVHRTVFLNAAIDADDFEVDPVEFQNGF